MLELPFSVQIGGGIKPGYVVKVRGRIGDDTSGFTVKLTCGLDPKDDAVFAVVPKNSNDVPMTCHKNGCWIKELVDKDRNYSFKIQSDFSLTIQCFKNSYKVSINSCFLSEYKHGLPCQLAKYVMVEGAVQLGEVTVHTAQGNVAGDRTTLIPVDRNLQWTRDKSLIVEGIPVKAEPHRMVFDFATNTSPQDILFHFNASFKDKNLGRNSNIGGKWLQGESDVHSSFPFAYGVPFKLEFIVDEEYIYVDLNGVFLLKYRHRKTPYSEIKKLNIFGSVVITKAQMEDVQLVEGYAHISPDMLTEKGRAIVQPK